MMIELKKSYKGKGVVFAGTCKDGQSRRIELDKAKQWELVMLFEIGHPSVQKAKAGKTE